MLYDDESKLPKVGTTISFQGHQWDVLKKMYDGVFSIVYLLRDFDDKRKLYAMKVEKQANCESTARWRTQWGWEFGMGPYAMALGLRLGVSQWLGICVEFRLDFHVSAYDHLLKALSPFHFHEGIDP
ncbi:hypothetical protein ANCCAN_19338 [Ancylostoma caninum]|uniref:Uncharacterized protein n=1 Tax=Ancylostoma caninum TaxID=29170 RepID=A0A368FRH9_ANCCA|nr:hypothetical protein ANCCAN_19338 [Ancylostoma caninum]